MGVVVIRRAALGYILGAGMSVAGIKHHTTNQPIPKAKGETANVVPESGAEPMPQYPYFMVSKSPKTLQRNVTLITERADLVKFTDDQIKDMAYRIAEYGLTRLMMFPTFVVNTDGSVTYEAQKGSSGETIMVTF